MCLAISHLLLRIGCLCLAQDTSESIDLLPRRVESRYVANVIQVHSKILSGGLPSGVEAFQELSSLGVRTIISVDAAKPDVATAKQLGMRYIHLPHGYDGIPKERIAELAKAVQELEGPIFIHCHHGKHRSPAAASVACVAAGLLPESKALTILKLAGTDPHYRGLYQVAQQVQPFSEEELSQIKVAYKEVADVPPLAEAMVELEEAMNRLKQIQQSNWNAEAEPSKLTPAAQALLLAELFAEMLRGPEVEHESAPYQQMLEESRMAAQRIHETLKKDSSDPEKSSSSLVEERSFLPELDGQLKIIADNCRACHHQFRDR